MVTTFGPQKQLFAYAKNNYQMTQKYVGYYTNEVINNESAFWESCYKYTPVGCVNYAAYIYDNDSYTIYKITKNEGDFYIPLNENPFCKQPNE